MSLSPLLFWPFAGGDDLPAGKLACLHVSAAPAARLTVGATSAQLEVTASASARLTVIAEKCTP